MAEAQVMSPQAAQEAADLLWDAWQHGRRIAAIPESIRPATRADGYEVQARLAAKSGAGLFGWKIAATSTAGQVHIAVDGPLAGRLLRERVIADAGELPLGHNHMRVAEAEFAFRMGDAMTPRARPYTMTEVLDAVDTLHPAIEVPDSRFDDFTRVGAAQLIADNACAHYFVLGAATGTEWRDIDLCTHRAIGRVPGVVEREGVGANVLGDPRRALAWLVNELSALGITLNAGEVVTTGTCLVPLPIRTGDRVEVDFGVLGRVSASIGT